MGNSFVTTAQQQWKTQERYNAHKIGLQSSLLMKTKIDAKVNAEVKTNRTNRVNKTNGANNINYKVAQYQ